MQPARRASRAAVLLIALTGLGLVACSAGAPPSASPSASPTVTTPAPSPTATTPEPTPTPSPTATETTPAPTWTVVSARVAYSWRWPNADNPATVRHTPAVPPVPRLVSIGAANHVSEPNDRPYNRISFSFTDAYPSYRFEFVNRLTADASGERIRILGNTVLRIVFNPAQAHTPDGTASSIISKPPAYLGLTRMVAYTQAGDFEGYLTYGVGITWPNAQSNAQLQVRVYEVTYVNAQGEHRYVVAFDVDAR